MKRKTFVTYLAIVLTLLAAGTSYLLLAKHLSGTSGIAWFDAGCEASGEQSGVSCQKVLASRYAYWPALPDDPSQKSFDPDKHIPVALLGLVYYSILAVWLIVVGAPSFSRRWFHLIPLGILGIGLVGSANYLLIMFTVIDQWCPWCLVTHVLNFGIASCALLMWPRKTKSAPATTSTPERPTPSTQPKRTAKAELTAATSLTSTHLPPHPSWRLALVALGAMGLIVFAQREMFSSAKSTIVAKSYQSGYEQCLARIKQLQGQTDRLVKLWQVQEPISIPIRDDDPIRLTGDPSKPHWDLVIFSDFECPSCKRMASFLEEKVQPLFDHRLRVIFKHFPINPDCNPKVSSRLHPHACKAIELAESARRRGGNDAFWRTHDYLFSLNGSETLAALDFKEAAQELGLDASAIDVDNLSPETQKRLQEDIQTAVQAGLKATPYLILGGKPVDSLASKDPRFWDQLADVFWQSIGETRPRAALLQSE